MARLTTLDPIAFNVADAAVSVRSGQPTIDLGNVGTRTQIVWSPAGTGEAKTWSEVHALIVATAAAGGHAQVVIERLSASDPELRIPAGTWPMFSMGFISKRYASPALNAIIIEDGAVLVDMGTITRSVTLVSQSSKPVFTFPSRTPATPPVLAFDTGGFVRNDGTAPMYKVPDGELGIIGLVLASIEPGAAGSPIMELGAGATVVLRLADVEQLDTGCIAGPANSTLIVTHNGTTCFPLSFPAMTGTIMNQALGMVGGAGPTSFRPFAPCTGCMYFNTDTPGYEYFDGVAWQAF